MSYHYGIVQGHLFNKKAHLFDYKKLPYVC